MMFESTAIFAEILLVGCLLLFAISPFLLRFFVRDDTPVSDTLDLAVGKRSWLAAAFMLALAYSVGIAGYRLVSDVFERIRWQPASEAEIEYKAWKPHGYKPESIEAMEYYLRGQSAGADEWVDRHKSYEKLLRTASFSALLFLVGMAFYRISRRQQQPRRYEIAHFVLTSLLAALFLYASGSEAQQFAKHILVFYKVLNPGHVP
jgi:hypothetical protein